MAIKLDTSIVVRPYKGQEELFTKIKQELIDEGLRRDRKVTNMAFHVLLDWYIKQVDKRENGGRQNESAG